MDEDNVFTFSEVWPQWRKAQFDAQSLRRTTLTDVGKSPTHLPNPSYVEKDDKFIYQNQQLQSP